MENASLHIQSLLKTFVIDLELIVGELVLGESV